jgi:ComF family protein
MIQQVLREGKKWLQSIWFEAEEKCLICQEGKGPVCRTCGETYFYPELERCPGCGKLLPEGVLCCTDCRTGKGPRNLAKVTALGYYSGAWRTFIQEAKFRGQPYLLERIGAVLAEWAIRRLPPPDVVMAVPMFEERLWERGFNQAEVLASSLRWRLGLPLRQGLVRAAPTLPQVSLSRAERLRNLTGVFRFEGSAKEREMRVWLVDDVITTGATLDECAGVLKEYGYFEIFGLCLAAGMEKKPPE